METFLKIALSHLQSHRPKILIDITSLAESESDIPRREKEKGPESLSHRVNRSRPNKQKYYPPTFSSLQP